MKQTIFLFMFLVALTISCTEEERDYTGNIQGIVTESGTTTPLSGVQVNVVNLGTSTTTGSDGQFNFNNIDADSYQLQFKKTGYVTNMRSVNVRAGETARCDMQLEPEQKEAEIEAITLGSRLRPHRATSPPRKHKASSSASTATSCPRQRTSRSAWPPSATLTPYRYLVRRRAPSPK